MRLLLLMAQTPGMRKEKEGGISTCSESLTLLALMLLMAGKATDPRLPTPMAAKAHPFVGAKAKATSLVRLAHKPMNIDISRTRRCDH